MQKRCFAHARITQRQKLDQIIIIGHWCIAAEISRISGAVSGVERVGSATLHFWVFEPAPILASKGRMFWTKRVFVVREAETQFWQKQKTEQKWAPEGVLMSWGKLIVSCVCGRQHCLAPLFACLWPYTAHTLQAFCPSTTALNKRLVAICCVLCWWWLRPGRPDKWHNAEVSRIRHVDLLPVLTVSAPNIPELYLPALGSVVLGHY
jgi:hypothetical protein